MMLEYMKKLFSKRILTVIFLLLITFGVSFVLIYNQQSQQIIKSKQQQASQDQALPVFSLEQLTKFDGTDPNLPIYIGLNGYVYDVTSGKKFYQTGGTYHYLAGKDSSQMLNEIGGDIIEKKYPIVGKYNF